MAFPRPTHTYATLQVKPETLADIVLALEAAGPEYVRRYVEKHGTSLLIHLPDVALVSRPLEKAP